MPPTTSIVQPGVYMRHLQSASYLFLVTREQDLSQGPIEGYTIHPTDSRGAQGLDMLAPISLSKRTIQQLAAAVPAI